MRILDLLPEESICYDQRVMKTTIDIPDEELREVLENTGATTKREAVVTAIAEFNRRRRLARLADRLGVFDHFLSHEELDRLRAEG